MSVVTVPVAANAPIFQWELDLFWFAHRRVYGDMASTQAHAIFIDRNTPDADRALILPWKNSVPHSVCHSIYDWQGIEGIGEEGMKRVVPLNIQWGLSQIIDQFNDDQVLELTDCDMFHFRPRPEEEIPPDVLFVDDIYEAWHLKSLTDHKSVIEPYFENGGKYYNGGFVPIIGHAATFKRILPDWMAVHVEILKRPYHKDQHWWAGMYALQAACERAKVQMVGKEYCYVPGAVELKPTHFVGHYSVDKCFDKRLFPAIDLTTFKDDPFYDTIRAWMMRYSH